MDAFDLGGFSYDDNEDKNSYLKWTEFKNKHKDHIKQFNKYYGDKIKKHFKTNVHLDFDGDLENAILVLENTDYENILNYDVDLKQFLNEMNGDKLTLNKKFNLQIVFNIDFFLNIKEDKDFKRFSKSFFGISKFGL